MVRTLICIVTCSVYLPRYVAVPPPTLSKKTVGKTTRVVVSTASTVPLNGVSAATALTAMLASDTAKAATSDEPQVTNLHSFPLCKRPTADHQQSAPP